MTSQNEDIIIAVISVIVGLVGAVIILRILCYLLEIIKEVTIFTIYVLLFFGGYIVRAIFWIGKVASIPLGIFLGVNTYREFYFLNEISRQEDVKIILSSGIWILSIYLISLIAYKISKKITEAIQEETGWFEKKAASNSNGTEKTKEEHAMKSEHIEMIEEMKKMTIEQMKKYMEKIHKELIIETNNHSLDRDSYLHILHYLNKKESSSKEESSKKEKYKHIGAAFFTLASSILDYNDQNYMIEKGEIPPL